MANPPRTEGHPYNIRILNDGSLVVSYSCRRAGSPQAFTRSSGVFYSTDGGQTWQDRTLINVNNIYGAPDMSYYTRDVVIDPTDATQNTWYAGVFGGWGGKGNEAGDVYRTTDRGVHWTRMQLYRSTAYPRGNSISVQSIAINPITHEMYVTTDTSGLLYAPDATKPGLSYTDFSDLTSFPYWGPKRVYFSPYGKHDVWTTSGGAGIWEGGVGPDGLTATATSSTQMQLSWNDNSDNEAGFQIDRATDLGFTQNLVTTTAGMNATSASITGLNPLTQYYFRVRATNGANKSANSGSVSATTLSANQAPTDIALSNSSVRENQPLGTAVGTLSTTDPNAGDTFTYTLVSGSGGTDNASFTISGNQLLTAASFDYETKSSYSIRVRTTDQGGLYTEKVFTITVTDVDEIAPAVTAVYVRGSSWASGYLSFLATNLPGSSSTYGFAIPVGSGAAQLQTLPWRNLDRISVAFSEDVSVARAQFAIAGSVGSYSVSGFSYNATDHVATWSLSAVIGPDKLYVALPGSGAAPVTDVAGNLLDGEWTNPTSFSDVSATSTFPSGNGVAGGDFAFRFDVLPGDSTGGSLGKVNVADVAQTKSRSSLPETASSYRSDFDGNNLINVADVAYVKSKSSIYSLPVDPPVLPVFSSLSISESLLLTSAESLLG